MYSMAEYPSVTMRAIGVVRNGVTVAPPDLDWAREKVSELVVDPALAAGLDGLEDFSHIIVLFWFDRAGAAEPLLKTHPRGRSDLPLLGVLATRSPNRPNGIGEATPRLLGRSENVLTVSGLDALDGTPVLDIKPYIPRTDSIPDARVPEWLTR